MPVTRQIGDCQTLYQRAQYAKGGVGRAYWDYRDRRILRAIPGYVQSVLDLGCGEGITLERLCQTFPDRDIQGIDILDENVGICLSRGLPASKASLLDIDRQSGSVDCCIMSEVIEHLADHHKALTEAHRILKPGGCLIVVFPNDTTFFFARLLTMKVREAFYDAGHVRQWTPRALRREFADTGFATESVKYLPTGIWPLSLHCIAVAHSR